MRSRRMSVKGPARRAGVVATGVVAVGLAFATVAWACTANMIGNIWFTTYVSNACTTTKVTSGTAGSTWCSQAAGLQTDTPLTPLNKYELRYAVNADACHNSGNKIKNNDSADGLFTAASGTGGWSNQRITLPPAGSWVVCAATPAAFDTPPPAPGMAESGWWSRTHLAISVS